MNDALYNEIVETQSKANGEPFWERFRIKYNFGSAEQLRSAFRRERERRKKSGNVNFVHSSSPKILLFDIETSPLVVFSWRIYDQRITPEQVIKDWYVISWSAKWLCDSTVHSDVIRSEETADGNDERVVKSMWKMLDDADIVVTHNGNQFDIKKLNTRFIFWGMNPPSHYQQIDTLQVARSNFDFTSNKLDYINGFLGIHQKTETNYALWKRCYSGEPAALHEMVTYNQNDVLILEELYFKLRPWIKGHPNVGLYFDSVETVCPNCGGELIKQGNYYTPLNRYDAYRCTQCGAVGRGGHTNLDTEKRKSIVRN